MESRICAVTSPNVWAKIDIAGGAVTVLTTKKERLTLTNSLLELGGHSAARGRLWLWNKVAPTSCEGTGLVQ